MKKILIVEDDADINRALCIRIKAAGYEVHSAIDAYSGLRQAVQLQPDLMIVDVSMPAGDGFSIIERMRIKLESDETPFIVLTASKRSEYKAKAEALGAAAFLEKPFDSSTLLECIDDAIAGVSDWT